MIAAMLGALVGVALLAAFRQRRRRREPSFKQISAALDADIAAARARGVKVDETERMSPSHRRIKF